MATEIAEATREQPGPNGNDAWYRSTWLQVYRYVYARVQNREEAEDVTQETYSRVLGRGEAAPAQSQYLFTTALNLIRDRWRRRQRRGDTLSLDEALLMRSEQEDDAVSKAWVRSLMDRLPEEYRTALDLHIVQGYSRAEVAEYMGKTEPAVRGLLYRALQSLRGLMREETGKER